MTDVFISYKKEDVARVEPIARALANAGYEVWWDHRIPPGRTYREVIGAALQDAKCVIVVWSSLSANAQWVLDEADEGKKRNVLLPLLIDDVEIPYGFRQIEAARLVGWSGDTSDHEWQGVLSAIQHYVGRAPGGPPKSLSMPSISASRAPAREPARTRSSGASMIGPVLGVAALAALGAGGYYAWQSGMLPIPPVASSDADDTLTDPTLDASGELQNVNTSNAGSGAAVAGASGLANLPPSPRRDVIVSGDEMGTFFASGYVYCDAKLLGDFWGQDIGETKTTVGWKILNGLGPNVPQILQLARNQGHACEWRDTGHSYADAERLAQLWGMAEPYQAKLRVAELYTNGRGDVVDAALGRRG